MFVFYCDYIVFIMFEDRDALKQGYDELLKR